MTDFKPGDRVTVRRGVHAYNDYETGYVREVLEGSDGHPRQLVLENGHWGYVRNAKHDPAPEPRPLVGPAPTPPAAPVYQAPFTVDGTCIRDAGGDIVAHVATNREYDDREKFATYVATALNASVFTED